MGMAPLSIALRDHGHSVIGYDDRLRPRIRQLLTGAGIRIHPERSFPEGVSRVVYSSAVSSSHPLLREAIRRQLPLARRGEMLAELVANRKLAAVVGSHGKTTTTAMLVQALQGCGHPFSYYMGGLFDDCGRLPARLHSDGWVVAEVDESDGTIDLFDPEITLILNLDWDHADFFADESAMEEAFSQLFGRTGSTVLIPSDDERIRRLAKSARCPVVSYGPGGEYELREIRAEGEQVRLMLEGRFGGREELVGTCGRFNAHNAVAALALARLLCQSMESGTLRKFWGVRRRQGLLGGNDGITVMEDYAHHPREISALLGSLRDRFSGRRVVVVFQPHRYSRTRALKAQFAHVLQAAEVLFLLEVYPASEPELNGGHSSDILGLMPEEFPADLIRSENELQRRLTETVRENDVVVFLGAGDIDGWAARYVERQGLTTETPRSAAEGLSSDHSPGVSGRSRWWESLARDLSAESRLVCQAPLAEKTTLRVGGTAAYFAEPALEADLATLLRSAHREGVTVFFLGRGSNLIVLDDGFDGLVIRLSHPNWKSVRILDRGRIWAGAGVRLRQVCVEGCRIGISGFEFLEGIPGTVGGSLRMNAGAMGGWIFDIVEEVRLMTLSGEVRVIKGEQFHVGYRDCRELKDTVALGAVLRGTSGSSQEEVRERIDAFARHRRETQPRTASAGCIFKNPKAGSAGKLIEELNLKGRRVGGAEISCIHGNFITNLGGATCEDVLNLIRMVRREALERRGIALEPEVLLLGRDWSEVL